MTLPRIRILATGGTIAGSARSAAMSTGYRAAALSVETLCDAAQGLDDVAVIEAEQVAAIDSKNATPSFWQLLAHRVQSALDAPEIDGVVITHGTDTLEESAYYLHLVLKSAKPVVLVGAMRPATSLSADGPLNLLNAVRVAASAQAAGRGVLVALNHRIYGARDVAKIDTMRPDSFGAPSGGPLGLVQDAHVVWLARTEKEHTVFTPFTAGATLPAVEILVGYAGVSASLVDAVAATRAKGLVWAGTGNGSVGGDVEKKLAAAVREGLMVVRASRTGGGYVMPGGSSDDLQWGFASAGTLSPYKARVLLMLALGMGYDVGQVREAFDTY